MQPVALWLLVYSQAGLVTGDREAGEAGGQGEPGSLGREVWQYKHQFHDDHGSVRRVRRC